ncbi:hypothetical protein VNO78_34900 [Psophocarpus tetragonolobus]|uniref:Uncharacterized protein n=1 Tax=Psophocarpus tetragonolobus TaxID=3891 RepID=A0AAN9NMU7_PSOTE
MDEGERKKDRDGNEWTTVISRIGKVGRLVKASDNTVKKEIIVELTHLDPAMDIDTGLDRMAHDLGRLVDEHLKPCGIALPKKNIVPQHSNPVVVSSRLGG